MRLVLAALLVCVSLAQHAQAQSPRLEAEIRANEATPDLPERLVFRLRAGADTRITRAVLRFGSDGRACFEGEGLQVVDIRPGTDISTEWAWDFSRTGSLPLGSEIWWEWELEDETGARLTTGRQTLVLLDESQAWNTLASDDLIIYYVEGGQAFASRIATIARDAAQRLGAEAGLTLTDTVRIFVYPNAAAMRRMILYSPEWAGGAAYPDHHVILAGIGLDEISWARQVIPHEFAHLVTGALTFNCQGVGLPTWMSEGISVRFENSLTQRDTADFRRLVADDRLIPLSELTNGFSARAEAAGEAYRRSGLVVDFMIRAYGPERMAQLLAAVGSGTRFEAALQSLYGVSVDALDLAWRAWLLDDILPLTPTPGGLLPTATTVPSTPVPTLALWTPVVQPSPTPVPTEPALAVAAAATPAPPTAGDPAASAATIPEPELPEWLIPGLVVAGASLVLLAFVVIGIGSLRRRRL
jgi:hypothetical protein